MLKSSHKVLLSKAIKFTFLYLSIDLTVTLPLWVLITSFLSLYKSCLSATRINLCTKQSWCSSNCFRIKLWRKVELFKFILHVICMQKVCIKWFAHSESFTRNQNLIEKHFQDSILPMFLMLPWWNRHPWNMSFSWMTNIKTWIGQTKMVWLLINFLHYYQKQILHFWPKWNIEYRSKMRMKHVIFRWGV